MGSITTAPIIDCDAKAVNPGSAFGWKVEGHMPGGVIPFHPSQLKFYLTEEQEAGGSVTGNQLFKMMEMTGLAIPNANYLDFLLANTHLIPPEIRKGPEGNIRYMAFFGTKFRLPGDEGLYVRRLYGIGGNRWLSDMKNLNGTFSRYESGVYLQI